MVTSASALSFPPTVFSVVSPKHRNRRACTTSFFNPFKNRSFGERDFERERDEQMELQRQILADRRSGKRIQEAAKRREALRQAELEKQADRKRRMADPKWKSEREIEMDKKRAEIKQNEPKSGIIVPLPPFNIPEFDNGERFDLRAPYTDEGWVDESEGPGFWGKLFGEKNNDQNSDSEDEEDSKSK